jgi:hypothetical protein
VKGHFFWGMTPTKVIVKVHSSVEDWNKELSILQGLQEDGSPSVNLLDSALEPHPYFVTERL